MAFYFSVSLTHLNQILISQKDRFISRYLSLFLFILYSLPYHSNIFFFLIFAYLSLPPVVNQPQ